MDFLASTAAAEKSGRKSDGGLDPVPGFRITLRRIGAGLQNLGNTCFLNSVLQCLTYTEPFAAYCHSGEHRSSCRTAGFCSMCALQNHVMNALQSTGKILSPSHLVKNLRCISRNFRNLRQEDAHEYMVNLLESMHKCCLPFGVPTESPSAYERSLVHKIFGGQLRSQVRCLQCNYCSNKFDPFLDLSLEILEADSLTRALTHFTAKEQLDGGEKQYQCQSCKQKVRASKQLTVHQAPYVLTIHLKRFGPDILGQKIDKKVSFEPSLDLKPFVSDPQEASLKYTLYGVLVHAGWSTHSGHYYCFVRTSSGVWHSLDDNQVRPVSEKTVLGQKAYMLFYVRDRSSAIKRSADVSHKENALSGALGSKVICRSPSINVAMQNARRKLSVSACSSAKFKAADISHSQLISLVGNSSGQTLSMEVASNGNTTQKESPPSQDNCHATTRQATALEATPKDSRKLENPVTETTPVTASSHNRQATNESTHPSDLKDNLIITTSHANDPSTCESQQVAEEQSEKHTTNLLGQDNLHDDGTINGVSQNSDIPSKMKIDRASASMEPKSICSQLTGINGNLKKEHFNKKSIEHQKTVSGADKCISTLQTQRTGKRPLEAEVSGLNTSIKMVNVANSYLQQKAVAVEKQKSASNCSQTKLERKKPGRRSLLHGQLFGRKKLFLTFVYIHKKKKHKRSKKHHLNSKSVMKNLVDLHANDQGVSTSEATKVVDVAPAGFSKKRTHSRSIVENHVLGAKDAKCCNGDAVHIRNLGGSRKIDTNIDDQGVSMSETNKVVDVASADSSKRGSGLRSNEEENVVVGLENGKISNGDFVHNKNLDRSSIIDAMLATSNQSRTPLLSIGNEGEGRKADAYGKGPFQKDVACMMTSLKVTIVPRWDAAELPSSQSHDLDNARESNIGYVLDEWDEEYDRGRRKKIKKFNRSSGGPNPFQEIANMRLKQQNMQSKRYGNQPLRI